MSDTSQIQNSQQPESPLPLLRDHLSSSPKPSLIRLVSREDYNNVSRFNFVRKGTFEDKSSSSRRSSVDTLSKKRASLNVPVGASNMRPRRVSKFKGGNDSPMRRSPTLTKQNSIKPYLQRSPTLRDKGSRRTLRSRSTKEIQDQSGTKSYSEIEELQNLYHVHKNEPTSNILGDMSPNNKKISMQSRIKQMYYQSLRRKMTRSDTQAYPDTVEFMEQIKEIKDNLRTPNAERIKDLVIVDRTPLERLDVYYDKYPLLKFRKFLWRIQKIISLLAAKIIKHPIFEYFILAVIVLNSVVLALDDPTTSGNSIPGIDNVLLGIYTAECVLKILGMGFMFNERAYLRDMWNILDFVIVVTGYIPLLLSSDGVNLQAFRALRVLRPLRTISKIEELRVLIGTLVGAFGPLMETLFILFFVYLIFAIAGLQLFSGMLKKRCFDIETGIPVTDSAQTNTQNQMLCNTDTDCPGSNVCGKMVNNPDYDITNFDTIQNSFLMVFQIVTQEGWSDIMYLIDKTFTPIASVYFIFLVVICAFFLLNLTLAVLKVKFTENTTQEVKAKNLNEKYWVHGEKYFDQLEYNKRDVLNLMEKRRQGEIEFNKYEMKKDNLIAVDVDKAHKFKAGVIRRRRRVDSNSALGWIQKRIQKNVLDKIKLNIPVKQSFSALVSLMKRTLSTKQSSSISPEGTLAKSQSVKRTESSNASTPLILITAKTKSLKKSETKGETNALPTENAVTESPDQNSTAKPLLTASRPLSVSLQKDFSSPVRPTTESSRLIVTPITEKSPKKADDSPTGHQPHGTPSLVVIPSIAEANEKSEHSLSGVTSKNFLSVAVKRNNFMSSSLKVTSPIRPLLAEKVQVNAEGGEKTSFINIAGIRNKGDQNQKPPILTNGTYVFDGSPVPESKEVSFNVNDEQSVFDMLEAKSPMGQVTKPKIAQKNKIINQINKINKPKHNKPRKSRLSVQPRLSALTSTFDLGDDDAMDQHVEGFVPTGILDDSDFLDERLRQELIRRKRQDTAIRRKLNGGRSPTKRTTRNMITSFGQLPRGESHTHVGSRKFGKGSMEGGLSSTKIYEEEEDDERFVIDIRYMKAIPAFEREYDATCEDDVLPSKKEREEKAQEEMMIESLKKARLKLEFKITPLDEKKAKERMESYYSRSSGYASIIGSSRRPKRTKTEESVFDGESKFGTNNSRQPLNKKSTSNFSKKKTYNPSTHHSNGTVTHKTHHALGHNANAAHNEDDYIKPEKMNDFMEILNRIEKPFDNEAGLDNPQIQDEKLKDFKFQEEYRKIRKTDLETYRIAENNWSGDNVLPYTNANFAINRAKIALNKQDFDRWRTGYAGVFHEFRRACKALIESSFFNNFIMTAVLLNTVLLATQGLVSDSATNLLNSFNLTFTVIFTIELALKVTGLGVTGYVRDNMNLFDCAIVVISLVEAIFLSGSKAVSAFRSIRLLRTFRVLRVTKLLRTLKYMQIIISIVGRSMKKFIYILILLFLFLFIYTLLGMQLFGGGLNLDDNVGANRVRQNFDSFANGFMASFQIMTQENWTDIAFLAVRSKSVNTFISLLYFISWIWIGNYILLNLFLAILLDEFTADETTNEYEDLEIEDDGSGTFSSRGTNFERSTTTKFGTGSNTQRSLSRDSGGGGHRSITSKTDDYGEDGESARQIKNHKTEIMICEKSLYIFSKQNPIRKICLKIIQHRFFDRAIMAMIVFSSVKLAFDTYYDDDTTNSVITVSNKIDYGINVFFALEASMKIISLGLFVDEGCYLRETWNQLDIIIVVASLLDMSIQSVNLGFIKILRLLRTLRPLRFITHNKNMRLIVTALLESVSAIFNVVIVMLLIWIMFAILAMNIWQGKLGYCSMSSNASFYHITSTDCAPVYGGVWTTPDFNFENIFKGIVSLFILSTQENWPNIMFTFEDANDPTIGPAEGSMKLFADIYFIIFMFVGTYFLVNLFIGVIFLEFSRAQKREDHLKKFLTPEQQHWVIIQRLLVAIKPDLSNVEPKGKIMKKVFRFINSTKFELFIMSVIILNIVIMALNFDTSSDGYSNMLNYINWGFSAIFLGELVLKHIGYGFTRYWANSWNKFDAFVVVASIFDILTTILQQSFFSFIRVGPQLARVFRVLRVSRLFKLVKQFEGLQKMLQTLVFTLPAVLNVGALLFLVYFIYAVLATYIFKNINGGQIIEGNLIHFMDFFTAIITLFRCSTGENWYIVMFDTVHPTSCLAGTYPCGTWAAYPFWLSFIVVCKFIFINLFVLVILQQFEDYHLNDDNPMNTFLVVMDNHITPVWEEFALKHGGTHIHISQLNDFFSKIPAPYGFKGAAMTKIEMSKALMQLEIPTDFDNMFYYNDIIFAVFRFGFQNKLTEEPDDQQSNYLNMHEEKTITKLNALKKNTLVPGLRRKTTVKEQTKSKKANIGANPIVRMLFMGMTMKAWSKYTHKITEKMKAAEENGVEYVESESEQDDYTFRNSDESEVSESPTISEEDEDQDDDDLARLNGHIKEEEEGDSDNDDDERIHTERESLIDVEHSERKIKQDGDEENAIPYNAANLALRGKYQRGQMNQGTKITITTHSSIKGASHVEIDKKPSASILSPQKLVKFVEGSDAAELPPQGYSFLDQDLSPKKFESKKSSRSNVEDGEKPSVINVNIQNNVIINNNFFVNATPTSENAELGAFSPIGTSVTIERNININRAQSQQQPTRFASPNRALGSSSRRELSQNDTLNVPDSKSTPVNKKGEENMEEKP